LPVFVFILANAVVFGLWEGFILSWIGSCAGSLAVFFLIRKIREVKFLKRLYEYKQVKKTMIWIENHGFGPLFLMLSFPFSPSALINVVSGLSKVSILQFLLAVFLGKFVMVFTVSWIGQDIVSLVKSPVKTILLLIFIFSLWLIGKQFEKRLEKQKQIKEKSKEEN
jgi:uncharacterized membrane protein YdjX (TVP38/TMEM64 family)